MYSLCTVLYCHMSNECRIRDKADDYVLVMEVFDVEIFVEQMSFGVTYVMSCSELKRGVI